MESWGHKLLQFPYCTAHWRHLLIFVVLNMKFVLSCIVWLVCGLVRSYWQALRGEVRQCTFPNSPSRWMQTMRSGHQKSHFMTSIITIISDHFHWYKLQKSFLSCSHHFGLSDPLGSRPGPLFILADGFPVSRVIFVDKLSMAIKYRGFDSSCWKVHSFRIGAASYAADAGMSDAQIRAL